MNFYQEKYLKYKNKYTNLKKFKGGNPMHSIEKSIVLRKEEYDELDENDQNKFPFYCPNESKYLCTLSSPSFGLCKNKLDDCDNYNGENTYPIYDISNNPEREELLKFGKKYKYELQGNKDCAKLTKNSGVEYSLENNPEIKVPKTFKILTWNLWYSMKTTDNDDENLFHMKFFYTRMWDIIENILLSEADIICLQEVGKLTFDLLYPMIQSIYPYFYENPLNFDLSNDGDRGRYLETMCLSKYPALSFKLFAVEGNLTYNNSMLMIEFETFIIFNVYLQAGTRNSPGQRDLWFNYSRCRYNEYMSIKKYIDDNNIRKPIIVLGDFNTNLNGQEDEWPELRAFKLMDLDDFWLKKYNSDSGFTEDTSVNHMRWNVKFEEKIFRIDGIFGTKDAFEIKKIKLIGTKPIEIDSAFQEKFIQYRVPDQENKLDKIRKTDDKIKIWPSDHFGVLAKIKLI